MSAKPRNRIVVFRLSQEEYSRLKAACDQRGSSTISAFTRSEVLSFLQTGANSDAFQRYFAELEGEIAGLKSSIAQLNHLLEGAHVQRAAEA